MILTIALHLIQGLLNQNAISIMYINSLSALVSSFSNHRQLRRDCQMLLFSATYEGQVMKFAQSVIANPVVIRLRKEEESLDNIKQYYIMCRNKDDKFNALSNIYGTIAIGQSMIFCHTRKTASWLAEQMTNQGHAVALLSGELEVAQRADVIQRFRDSKEKVLITTNVSARGNTFNKI